MIRIRHLFLKLSFILGRGNRFKIALLTALIVGTSFLEMLGIGIIFPLLGVVLDPHFMTRYSALIWLSHIAHIHTQAQAVVGMSAMVVGVFLIKNVILFFTQKFQASVLHTLRGALGMRLLKLYLGMPYEHFMERNTAFLIHQCTGQINNFVLIFLQNLLGVISSFFLFSFIFGLLLFNNLVATLSISLGISIFVTLYLAATKKKAHAIGQEQDRILVDMYKCIQESLGAFKEVVILERRAFFLSRFNTIADRYRRIAVTLQEYQLIPKLGLELFFVIAFAAFISTFMLSGGHLELILPTLSLYILSLIRVLPLVNTMTAGVTQMRMTLISLETLFTEMSTYAESTPPPPLLAPLTFSTQIKVADLSFMYPSRDEYALHELSFEIAKSSTVGIVGSSGAGKTTLIDVLLGVLNPQRGGIYVDGVSIQDNLPAWHQLIGYVPQSIYLLDDTIEKNIAFGIPEDHISSSRIQEVLQAAQLSSWIQKLPQGIETVVGDKGVKLSGGQRQRIGIARALYHNPEVLVFDEATSALDAETESAVSEAIVELGRSKTLVIIAHRLSTVKHCDKLFLMEAGHIAASGTYEELLKKNDWFKLIHQLNFEKRIAS